LLTGTADIDATGNALANRLTGNAGDNVLNGGEGDDLLLAGEGSDILDGSSGDDRLDGGLGDDTMLGGAGNDLYLVDSTGDMVFETTTTASGIDAGGIDTVRASVSFNLLAHIGLQFVERVLLTGTADIDATGNALANRLTGNAGDNVLNGGLGSDRLTSGAGSDSFVFNTALGAENIDRIVDFTVTEDAIVLDAAIFVGLASGALDASAFAINETGQAASALDQIIYETVTGRLYFDSDGAGGAARVQFATLAVGLSLTSADFFVF